MFLVGWLSHHPEDGNEDAGKDGGGKNFGDRNMSNLSQLTVFFFSVDYSLVTKKNNPPKQWILS